MSAMINEVTAFALAIGGCSPAAPPTPVPIEVWRVGDDGLTLRFAEALRARVRRSTAFTTSRPGQAGRLVLIITQHLDWEEVGTRVRATFQIDIRNGEGRLLGHSQGSCWETQFETCAAKALQDAGNIARSQPNRD